MTTIKIFPPSQLPAEGVTDVQFNIWKEELEVYLDIDPRFQKFLPGGIYHEWEPAENDENRIVEFKAPDTAATVNKSRRELRQFLSIIAKLIHPDYYNPIIRHSSSISWIYNRIRQDYDLQQQGIHFMNILDITWDSTAQTTPIGFYDKYRSLIMGNLGKRGDRIEWQNSSLTQDEKLLPSHEDLILLNVLQLLHPKLPKYVKENYVHKIRESKKLMDFKNEILTKVKKFIEEIETECAQASNVLVQEVNADQDPSCNFMQTQRSFLPRQNFQPRTNQFRNNRPAFQQKNYQPRPTMRTPNPNASSNILSPFCRLCHALKFPRHVYQSHYLGQDSIT